MRELKFGEKIVRIRASAPAMLYYKQEFGTDLIGDMVKIMEGYAGKEDTGTDQAEAQPLDDILAMGDINFLTILQLAWAMNKADQIGKSFPKFESWLDEYGEDIDFSDTEFILNVVEEATNGFFRKNAGVRGALTAGK
ncbi:hypothetical protein ABIE27_004080 [Paenibacillus sp. 4624]|uniref:hypothetical protein n=1 Tax=Paenibacillus sp. 4624 TaxID=3156453 RepID=UPI003D1F676E